MGALTNTATFALTNYNTTFSPMCPISPWIDPVQSFMDKQRELELMVKNIPLVRLHDTPARKSLPKRPHVFKSNDYVQISYRTLGYTLVASIAAAILFGTCCVVALT